MCRLKQHPPFAHILYVASSSGGVWEIGVSDSAASTYAHHVARSSRCTSPPLPGHLIMQISPEAGRLHSATQAGMLPNNHDPDLNANGPVTSKCSVPTSYVTLEVTEEKIFIPVAGRSHESIFSYKWDSQNI